MKLHLISLKTCPFVQRAVITLKQKEIEHEVTYIDPYDAPDWFSEISPLGKVPVLRVGDEVLFESAVINEYLDEITGGELQPSDPLARAKNRAWIEIASNMVGNLYMLRMSEDQESHEKYRDILIGQLGHVEKKLGDGPWFSGEQFTLADTSFAPFFFHDDVANGVLSTVDADTMPKTKAWSLRLLALPAVKNSVVPEFESLYIEGMKSKNSYIWQQYIG